jgi:hypothetical protein
MHDADGPVLASMFYRELMKQAQLEPDDVAYSLDAAVQSLKAKGVSLSRWASFVHIGA